MTKQFQTKATPHIIFEDNKSQQLSKILSGDFQNPLVLLSASSASSKAWRSYMEQEENRNFFHHIEAFSGEPTAKEVDQIVSDYRRSNIDSVIAWGGGSTLDRGKAVAAMLCEKKPVENFLEGVGKQRPSGKSVPFIAIPTTAGTGSEATANAVLSQVGPKGYKKSLRHNNYIPHLALIDPTLTLSCPPDVTASCGMDCFSQLVEGFLSTKANSISDAIALDGLQAVASSLFTAYHSGENSKARSRMSYATLCSGIVLTNAGLGTVHGFASALGSRYHIPHGTLCGIIMAEANARTLAEIEKEKSDEKTWGKYAKLGKIFGATSNDPKKQARFFIDFLRHCSRELSLPQLADFGFQRNDFPELIKKSNNKNNPVQLSEEQRYQLLCSTL